MTRAALAVFLLTAGARAEGDSARRPRDTPRFPGFYSRLSLTVELPSRAEPPGTAAVLRFGESEEGGKVGFAFGAAASTLLFSLAAVNALVPRWLPHGAAQRWGLNGQGRTSTPYGEGGAP